MESTTEGRGQTVCRTKVKKSRATNDENAAPIHMGAHFHFFLYDVGIVFGRIPTRALFLRMATRIPIGKALAAPFPPKRHDPMMGRYDTSGGSMIVHLWMYCRWCAPERARHHMINGRAETDGAEGIWRAGADGDDGTGQSFANADEIEQALQVATTQLNHRAKPWIWGRPPRTRRHLRRLFCYRL